MGFPQMGCRKDRRTSEGGGCGGDEGRLEEMRHFGGTEQWGLMILEMAIRKA